MIKLSKMTDYAVVVVLEMAKHAENQVLSTAGLARDTKLPEPTVAKVLKSLTRAGVIKSVRGASGGYTLAHPPASISLLSVVEGMEGPIALTSCCSKPSEKSSVHRCVISESCAMKHRWAPVNAAVCKALSSVTIDQMVTNGTEA